MGEGDREEQLRAIWRQSKVPIVFRHERPSPLLIKVPYALGNKELLRDDGRNIPGWNARYHAWEIPQAWFEKTIKLYLNRYKSCYVIQLHRERRVCAPACWNAKGIDCECSCMGENHGTGHPGDRWYEIDETLAVSWGVQRYACRLIRARSAA